jgi:hypothetical protein
MLQQMELQSKWPQINAVMEYLKEIRQDHRHLNTIKIYTAMQEQELLEVGQWLTVRSFFKLFVLNIVNQKKELQKLHEALLQKMDEYLQRDDEEEWFSKEEAVNFAKALITLCTFSIGGQRAQLILDFRTEVSFV